MRTIKRIFYLSGNETLELKSIIGLLDRCEQRYTFYRFSKTPDEVPLENEIDDLCHELKAQISSKVFPVLIGWFDKYLSNIPKDCAVITESKDNSMLFAVAETIKEKLTPGEELAALCCKEFSVSDMVARGFSLEDILDYAERDFLIAASSKDFDVLEEALKKGQILNCTFCCKLPEFDNATKIEKSIEYAKWYGMIRLYEAGIDSRDLFIYGTWFYYRGDENLANTMKLHVCSGLGYMESANVFICKYPVNKDVINGHLDILAERKGKKVKVEEFCSIH